MNDYINFLSRSEEKATYFFSSDSEINETEYETMNSQKGDWFLPAEQGLQNGERRILYSICGKEPLPSALLKMDADRIPYMIQDVAGKCLWIKEHSVLQLRNVVADPAWIYWDPDTENVEFLYIPSKTGIYPDEEAAESALRKGLASLIRQSFEDLDLTLEILVDELEDPELGLEYFRNYMQDEASTIDIDGELQEVRVLCLKPLDLRHTQWIEVSRLPFLIGRKGSRVDGVISENKLVSRIHCRIDRKSDAFTIMDLSSKNGTRVNQTRLEPEIEYLIHAGDIIGIADVEFQLDWKYPEERSVAQWSG